MACSVLTHYWFSLMCDSQGQTLIHKNLSHNTSEKCTMSHSEVSIVPFESCLDHDHLTFRCLIVIETFMGQGSNPSAS